VEIDDRRSGSATLGRVDAEGLKEGIGCMPMDGWNVSCRLRLMRVNEGLGARDKFRRSGVSRREDRLCAEELVCRVESRRRIRATCVVDWSVSP